MRQLATGYYGKIPSAGDFQRSLPALGPSARFFDWFNDGWVRTVLVGKRSDLDRPRVFALRAESAAATAFGLLRSSRDRVGRRFPLFVFGAFEAPRLEELTRATTVWYERALGIAEAGSRGIENQVLRGQVESLRLDPDDACEGTFREWASTLPAASLMVDDGVDVGTWLRSLEYAFSGSSRPHYVLRGRSCGGVRGFSVVLNVLNRLAGADPEVVFWDQDAGSPDEGVVAWRATWDYPVQRHFEPLIWHDASGGSVYDVDPGRVPVPDAFLGSAAPMVEAGSTVLALMEHVRNVYTKT